MSKDYYKILGVEKDSSKDEIKKAFRVLAHKYHPDKKNGDEAKFKEVNEAYGVLSNDKKRAEYDSYGRVFGDGVGGAGFGGFEGFDFGGFSDAFSGANGSGFGTEFDLGDIFGEFFGGRERRQKRGRDISIDLEINFAESVFGIERRVLISKNSKCAECDGTGAKKGTELKTCEICNGRGRIKETRRSILGSFTTETACRECSGAGKIPKEVCATCRGAGIFNKQEEIVIKVPAGINDGEMIRISGMGEGISKGESGDLYVKIHVAKHPILKKEGTNIVMPLDIKITDSILGGKYNIDTLDGKIEVKIPEGSKDGDVLRVKGRGVVISKSKRGDLLLKLKIRIPQNVSRKAKKFFEELRDEGI